MPYRSHFFAVAGRAMRDVVVDYLRRRQAHKRDPGSPVLALNAALLAFLRSL